MHNQTQDSAEKTEGQQALETREARTTPYSPNSFIKVTPKSKTGIQRQPIWLNLAMVTAIEEREDGAVVYGAGNVTIHTNETADQLLVKEVL
jgi:hypothetical protein